MSHLWEIETAWFEPQGTECMNHTFEYRSWNEFIEYKPYQVWKPYILSSWSWKENTLQIVFISPNRFVGMNRAEITVKQEEEPRIREWIKKHKSTFWDV